MAELLRPWKRYVTRNLRTDEKFIMTRRNYNVNLDIGRRILTFACQVILLDTGAGPNFVRKGLSTSSLLYQVQEVQLTKIRDANSNLVCSIGLVALALHIERKVIGVDFIVCARLAVPVF